MNTIVVVLQLSTDNTNFQIPRVEFYIHWIKSILKQYVACPPCIEELELAFHRLLLKDKSTKKYPQEVWKCFHHQHLPGYMCCCLNCGHLLEYTNLWAHTGGNVGYLLPSYYGSVASGAIAPCLRYYFSRYICIKSPLVGRIYMICDPVPTYVCTHMYICVLDSVHTFVMHRHTVITHVHSQTCPPARSPVVQITTVALKFANTEFCH